MKTARVRSSHAHHYAFLVARLHCAVLMTLGSTEGTHAEEIGTHAGWAAVLEKG
jgi:hypothetical protein